ncbi:MAG: heavy metal translocating P-type ATPase [Acetobacteraceae bacterium]
MIPLPRARRVLFGFVLFGLAAGFAAQAGQQLALAHVAWAAPAALVAAVVAADLIAGLRRGAFGVDMIALLAIAAALVLGQHLAAVIVATMVAGGTALEEFAEARARRELAALVWRAPQTARRIDGEAIVAIPAEAIRPGDLLLVQSGEIVPADGTVNDAPATLDESALTGEPIPLTHTAGCSVQSGVLNVGAPFQLRATASAERSTYAAVVRLVQAAERDRPPMVRLADRWAVVFLAVTLVAAGIAWALAGDPVRALAVLVVATPCPLILAAPVALIAGVSRAARRGVIVKGGGALERLARVRTAILDKTGTLTSGTPRVAGVAPLRGFTAEQVMQFTASLEQASQHVVAVAIVAAARARNLGLSRPSAVEEFPGAGLAGLVEGRQVLAGNAGLLAARGLTPPEDSGPARLAKAAAATVWVALDGRLAGAVLLTDPIRPEAPRALRALRAAGLQRLVMASGDRRPAADEIGRRLGLDAVHAELTPAAKIAVVRAEHGRAPTLMIGDGINDAPALAAADIGLAMGARGAAAASEAADAVLMVDRLDRAAEAVVIARRSRAIALQSIGAGMGLSVLAMAAAAAGYLPPVAGALLQEAIDVAVILNALRALSGVRPPQPLEDRAAVQRLVNEHQRLRALLERMRRAAERTTRRDAVTVADLRAIAAELNELMLPHQQDEERSLYPALADRLGGHDPLGTMARMHEEIAQAARRFELLVAGMPAADFSDGEIEEARRLLHVLDALIALHLSTEEDLVSAVEDLPAPARDG